MLGLAENSNIKQLTVSPKRRQFKARSDISVKQEKVQSEQIQNLTSDTSKRNLTSIALKKNRKKGESKIKDKNLKYKKRKLEPLETCINKTKEERS